MIKAMQVLVENLGQVGDPLAPGWYYNSVGGWYYVDVYGNAYWGNPYTGQLFIPLTFHANHEYNASTINASAPILVLEGDVITVNFSFQYKGDARSIAFIIGNCAGILGGYYTIGNSVTKSVSVSASTVFQTYSGSTTFTYTTGGGTVGTAPHLFINPQDCPGGEEDTVYRDAFKYTEADVQSLQIISYAKAS